MENFNTLIQRTTEISHLSQAAHLLEWDQQTYMPAGAADARAAQLATLEKLKHQMMVSEETARLIEAASAEVAGMSADSDEVRIVQVLKEDYERTTKLPEAFVVELTKATALGYEKWVLAREANDYESFRPTLEHITDLLRQQTDYLGYEDHPYDALLDLYEPGMKTAHVVTVFENLRAELVPFAQAIFAQVDTVSDAPLHQAFPVNVQRNFGLMVSERFGYDFSRGRQDEVVHPFCTSFSRDDVRITTRFESNFLNTALFGTLHETGHALYEQGVAAQLDGTLLDGGVSMAIHESQSRLWENVVGRSRGFWNHFYPSLQESAGELLADVSVDDFYRAINKVQPSFIRIEADEVTYPLHIMLRFELETQIITGELDLKDAPDAWNAKMESYLGIVPETNANGILQDVHWSAGLYGYFPTYALGTLLSAQLFEKAVEAHPSIPTDITQGEFGHILDWMRTHIYQHGRKFTPNTLIERATGGSLEHHAYMRYLNAKYSEIYDL